LVRRSSPPLPPPATRRCREFLCFILSREGQEAIVRHTGYLPLTADTIGEQLRKLE
jgi:phosphate transport system substrate-binding protein